jgi:DNA replication protein DnaC
VPPRQWDPARRQPRWSTVHASPFAIICSPTREACLNGYNGRFYNAQVLLAELYASLADRSTPKLLKRLSTFMPMVIDELGYLTLKPEQTNAFFRLMDQH